MVQRQKDNDSWRLVCSTHGTRFWTLTASWMHNFFSSSILSDNFSKRASFLAAKAVNLSRSTALGREDKLSPVGGKRVSSNDANLCWFETKSQNSFSLITVTLTATNCLQSLFLRLFEVLFYSLHPYFKILQSGKRCTAFKLLRHFSFYPVGFHLLWRGYMYVRVKYVFRLNQELLCLLCLLCLL